MRCSRGHSCDPASRAVVTLGSEALDRVAALRPRIPVVSSMVLDSGGRSMHPAGQIRLEIPPSRIFAELRKALGGKTRAGAIRYTAAARPDRGLLEAAARQEGFTLRIADCSGPDELLKAFRSLRGLVDFVLTFPDSALYNSTTVRPLVMASLESGLPLIGFSASFVRAGAALGIYADFRDVGSQTAEVVQQCLAGSSGIVEGPRKVSVAANQRVFRLLGLEARRDVALTFLP